MTKASFFLFFVFFFSSLGAYANKTKLNKSQIKQKLEKLKKENFLTNLPQFSLNSNEIEHDEEKQEVLLSGNVFIKIEDFTFKAEKVFLKLKERTFEATGNVLFKRGETHIKADKVSYNFGNNTGVFYKSELKTKKIIVSSDKIEKIGHKQYRLEKGNFTSCQTCPRFWLFSGYDIELEIEDYAFIKFPVLYLLNIPILALPAIVLPVKTKRQSGLLAPNLEHNSLRGFSFSQNYFWAISRSQDMTVGVTDYKKRGLKFQGEYRYILDEKSHGKSNLFYMRDKEMDRASRWLLEHYHIQEKGDYIFRGNLSWISDNLYINHFPQETNFYGDPALENKFSVTKNKIFEHWSVELDYYRNLLNPVELEDNTNSVHRLPDIKYQIIEYPIKDFLFNFNFRYTFFYRRGLVYDNVRSLSSIQGDLQACAGDPVCENNVALLEAIPDGTFDPELDILRSGQRIIFHPSLSYPMNFSNKFLVTPTLSYQENRYFLPDATKSENFDTNISQKSLKVTLDMETAFHKTFDMNKTPHQHTLKVIFRYVQSPWQEFSNSDFFGDFSDRNLVNENTPLNQDDFFSKNEFGRQKLQFDYEDRFFNTQLVQYNIINQIIRKKEISKNNFSYKKVLDFKVFQNYDFKNKRSEGELPWSPITGTLKLDFDNAYSYSEFRYYTYSKVQSFYSNLRFFYDKKNFLELSYNKDFAVDSEQNRQEESLIKDMSFGSGFLTKYLAFHGKINYSLTTDKIKSWDYNVGLAPPGECWALLFGQTQLLNSPKTFYFSFRFYPLADSWSF